MGKKKDSYLAERITHQTSSRPFLIHHTLVNKNIELALYLHYHNEMELFYMAEGEVNFVIEDETYRLKSGDAMFVP